MWCICLLALLFLGLFSPNGAGIIPRKDVLCKKLLPGLARMSLGEDIRTLDLFPPQKSNPSFGFTILHFTCNMEKKFMGVEGETYDIPDQFENVVSLSTGSFQLSASVQNSVKQCKESMAAQVGIDVKVPLAGSFSSSVSYGNTREQMLKLDKTFTKAEASQELFVAELDMSNPRFSPNFERAMNNLPQKYKDGPEAYESFLSQYGTHFYREGRFGGQIIMTIAVDKSYAQGKETRELEIQAKASFDVAFVSASAEMSYNSTNQEVNEEFRENSETKLDYYGGHTNPAKNNPVGEWFPTVVKDPWLMGGRLESIVELIPDRLIRVEVDAAIKFMKLNAYLADLMESLSVSGFQPGSELMMMLERNLTRIADFCQAKEYNETVYEESVSQISYLMSNLKLLKIIFQKMTYRDYKGFKVQQFYIKRLTKMALGKGLWEDEMIKKARIALDYIEKTNEMPYIWYNKKKYARLFSDVEDHEWYYKQIETNADDGQIEWEVREELRLNTKLAKELHYDPTCRYAWMDDKYKNETIGERRSRGCTCDYLVPSVLETLYLCM